MCAQQTARLGHETADWLVLLQNICYSISLRLFLGQGQHLLLVLSWQCLTAMLVVCICTCRSLEQAAHRPKVLMLMGEQHGKAKPCCQPCVCRLAHLLSSHHRPHHQRGQALRQQCVLNQKQRR